MCVLWEEGVRAEKGGLMACVYWVKPVCLQRIKS